MSKILEEITKLTGVKAKRGEDRQDLLMDCMVAVKELSDGDWKKLSDAAQDWFNDAADAKNAAGKGNTATLPDFPDVQEETSSRRRGSDDGEAKSDAKAAAPKVKDQVKVITKRGKEVEGKVLEIDKEVIVLEVDGKEEEYAHERIESITVLGGEKASKGGDAGGEPEDPVKVGNQVKLTTKRGKEVEGKIVELEDNLIVLEVDGKDEEFDRDRVASIELVGGRKSAAKEDKGTETSSRRRGSDDGEAAGKGGDAKEEKTKRVSNGDISIGTRIKELIADNMEASVDEIGKLLKKEDLEFKENTLKLNYTDAHKFLDILKAKKKLK